MPGCEVFEVWVLYLRNKISYSGGKNCCANFCRNRFCKNKGFNLTPTFLKVIFHSNSKKFIAISICMLPCPLGAWVQNSSPQAVTQVCPLLSGKYILGQDLILHQLMAGVEREHQHQVGVGLFPCGQGTDELLHLLQCGCHKQFAVRDWVVHLTVCGLSLCVF